MSSIATTMTATDTLETLPLTIPMATSTSVTTSIEPEVESQHSPFLTLPAELLNLIAYYAFTTTEPIVNPSPNTTPVAKNAYIPMENLTIKPKNQSIPPLGTALLRTCSYLSTLDIRPLYLHNTLIFSRVNHLTAFVASLSQPHRRLLKSMTLSLSEASVLPASSDGTPTDPISLEWLHYLTCPAHMRGLPPGFWCSRLSVLGADLPYLQRLSIDIRGLRRGGGVEVKVGTRLFLRHLLAKVSGLERVEIVGGGADIWDLASVSRPFGQAWGEIGRWLELVGDALFEVLGKAVADDGDAYGDAWVGFMTAKDRYGIVACKTEPSMRDVVAMGYEQACSWERAVGLTEEKKMWRHPVFRILGAESQCS
ncbi:hypothetical protein MBLNU457_g2587t1 [Dothideomycetes sp. NU457]